MRLGSTPLLAHADHAHDAGMIGGLDAVSLTVLGAGVFAALVALIVLFALLRRRSVTDTKTTDSLTVSLKELPRGGPPPGAAVLSVYNVPVRLSLLVLAPAGRSGKIPPNELLPQVIDAITPQLMKVLESHQPDFRRWPPQLSSQGFAQTFFNSVPLPGDGGKGTPWCSVAGKINAGQQQFLVAMVCTSAEPNSLGQIAIQQEGQWLDVLRVDSSPLKKDS